MSCGIHGSRKLDYQCCWWCNLQVQFAFHYLNFLFDCHAVATNVWEIRDCNPDGLGASYCLSLAKMVAIHALGYLGVSLDGDGLG